MSSGSNNASFYGGDEINAIVLDPGSYNTRIGYAGDDFPKITTSSHYGALNDGRSMKIASAKGKTLESKRLFGEMLNVPRANFEIKPILKESIITDWDAAIDQYKYYFDHILSVNYKEQPILITEPVWTNTQYRKRLIETFYENFDYPALFLAKAPTCVAFQQGRPNCLVVDIGHDSVSITPVIDGISLLKNSMKTNYAGQFLDDQLQDLLSRDFSDLKIEASYKIKSKTPTVYPEDSKYELKSIPQVTQSFDAFQKQRVWHEFKETMLEAPEKVLNGANSNQSASLKDFYSQEDKARLFEFPTGQSLKLSLERYLLVDSLFDPESYKFSDLTLADKYPPCNGELNLKTSHDDYRPLKRARKADSSQSTPAPDSAANSEVSVRGISQLISHALAAVDIDFRSSVAHNIIITGGTSLIPQLSERLYNEVSNSNPGLKIRLHAVGNTHERSNQAWIGASILSSLGTFHQMWVSKDEYEEAGAERILSQRFR